MENTILKSDLLKNINEITKNFLEYYIFDKFEKDEFTIDEFNQFLKNDIKYIENLIFEAADSYVTIRNEERLEWLKDNYYDFEEYVKNVWIDSKNFDLFNCLWWAMVYQNEWIIYDDLKKLEKEFNLNFNLENYEWN